jgi:hypothetical protein
MMQTDTQEKLMALAETVEIDRIEIVGNGIVQVREATTITKDGEFFARKFRRWTLTPGADLTGQPANVVAQCQAAWTPEVVAAYQAQMAASGI